MTFAVLAAVAAAVPYVTLQPQASAGLFGLDGTPISAPGAGLDVVSTAGVDWGPRLRLEVLGVGGATRYGPFAAVLAEPELAWPIGGNVRVGPAVALRFGLVGGMGGDDGFGMGGATLGLVFSVGPHDHARPRWEALAGLEAVSCGDCFIPLPRIRVHRYAPAGLVVGGEAGPLRLTVDVGFELGFPRRPYV